MPSEFADLAPELFPFTVDYLRDGEPVATVRVSGPGVLDVPALGTPEDPVMVRITFADGSIVYGRHADKLVTDET